MPFFNHHIGVGLEGVVGVVAAGGGEGDGGEEEGGALGLGASDVAALLTHASLPSSSRTCNQSPFTSRMP